MREIGPNRKAAIAMTSPDAREPAQDEVVGRMPKPQPGHPRLYDVQIGPSRYDWHLDIEAKFPDYVFPEGAELRFFWDKKDLDNLTQPCELWVQAGQWRTRWKNGKPSLRDLVCDDTQAAPSKVRLEAIGALWALYKPLADLHNEAMRKAQCESAVKLNDELSARTKHLPHISKEETYRRMSQDDWIPGIGPVPGYESRF